MYSIFHIEGGIGKNILATAVVSSLKESDPERNIIVVTAWPQVWHNNPDVGLTYSFNQVVNFYKNFVVNKDTKIYRQEPYHHEDYVLKKDHLIKTWCNLVGVEWNGKGPKLYFSQLELEFIKIKMLKGVDKPIFLLQTNGGGGQKEIPYSWYRDLPASNVKDIVEYFRNDYHIYQIGTDNQPLYDGCHRLVLDQREILGCIPFSRKRLFIDSFAQHASAALGVKSVVCWIGNKPEVLGYETNENVLPDAKPVLDTYHYSYLEDFDISGLAVQYPYDKLKIFNSVEIINRLQEL